MAAEYSNIAAQTVAANNNIIFTNGTRICRRGYVQHRDDSGIFTLKGAGTNCKAVYRVQFNANAAVAEGGNVGAISVALTIGSEPLGNAVAIITPAAVGDAFNLSVATFIEVPCGCCYTVAVKNTSATAIDIANANIIIDRVA